MMTTGLIIVGFIVSGGAVGYLAARLLCRGPRCPVAASRWVMVIAGAVAGLYLGYSTSLATPCQGQMADCPEEPHPISSAEQWDEVLANAQTPVVLDFHAKWCSACRALAPVVDELAAGWAGRVTFYKADVDEVPELASRFGVEGIPMLVYFADGQERHRTVGLMSKADLEAVLQTLVDGRGN